MLFCLAHSETYAAKANVSRIQPAKFIALRNRAVSQLLKWGNSDAQAVAKFLGLNIVKTLDSDI